MKKYVLVIVLCILSSLHLNAQDGEVTQDDEVAQNDIVTQEQVNIACFVLSELMAKAKDDVDFASVLILSNSFDIIKKNYDVGEDYIRYFDSFKAGVNLNKQFNISLSNSPIKIDPFINNENIDPNKSSKDRLKERKKQNNGTPEKVIPIEQLPKQ